MKRHAFSNTLATVLAAVVLTSTTLLQAAQANREEYKELTASSGGTLTFTTVGGAIEIKTHDRDTVVYDAELKAGGWFSSGSAVLDQIEFDYEKSGGDVKITMKWKNDKQPRRSNLNAHHTLLIPAHYNIDVRTAGGSIKGTDINGKVAARTSGGSIRFGKVTGDLKVHTSGGSIALDDVKGDADAQTSGGSINVAKR
jgi:DUF4097 and DUF4098 domain-containing protein YvlB